MDDFTSDFVLEIKFNFREMSNIDNISEICSHMKCSISAKWPNILLISSVKNRQITDFRDIMEIGETMEIGEIMEIRGLFF